MLRRAAILETRKKCVEARDLYEKAYVNLCQDASRPPDLHSILILYHRASLLESLPGQTAEAKDAYVKVKDACRNFLGTDSSNEELNQNVRAIRARIPAWCS